MITVDKEKCIGCGKCVRDCFPGELTLVDGKAEPNGTKCIECGHCIAVCPKDAITLLNYDESKILRCSDIEYRVDPDTYLNHLKVRRSIRSFKKLPIEKDDIYKILDAGRFSPTGGNLQNVSYYVSQKEIGSLKSMLLDELKRMGDEAQASGQKVSWYSDLWLEMYEEFHRDGTDRLFFDADTVIVISSNSPQSGCIAAAHMETMVYSLGLGMLYSGFSTRAINASEKLRSFLKLKAGFDAQAVLVIGHPAVEYVKSVPRKTADVIWN